MFAEDENVSENQAMAQLKSLEKDIVRTAILKDKKRIDGRGLADVRQIQCEVGVLPRTHGSALFTRGETQALVVTTLGMTDDEQRLESLEGMQRSNFMLHYNFPPFSVGECGRIGTGRREIGHGKLAWRAISSSLPLKENFPYTLRVVSEITESNGSSSMATVCGTSLSLMDAGVPIKEPVAGIAMGLIKEGDNFSVLSDILGDEDHLGDVKKQIADKFETGLRNAFKEIDKKKRSTAISEIETQCKEMFAEDENVSENQAMAQLKSLEKDIVRTAILKDKKRIDGRGLADVRQIQCEVGVLPRTHGSALFTRGETQALVVTTLGMTDDEQRLESLEGMQRSNFMLHYNFPPFSVGECGRIGTGRREIGHGKLAWRAISSSLPLKENFPYTLRVVSEITESNGSSSMATVCGTSLSLMDAGVPIKEPVAGIAMGLIKEGDEFSVLSDILGDEDHLGDMDFKVAGTKSGITSLQMDIKITGITFEIMEKALDQAKDGREHILSEMNKALKTSRKEFSKHTPKMEIIKVDKKDIATVIGKGGATIREIVETSGAKVDVKDTGEVTVAAPDEASRNKAIEFIKNLVAKPEMGKIYKGKVVKIMEFGAFVNFLGKQDGLVHISELAEKRVAKVGDVVKEGDEVSVKVVGFDRGKVKLSMKQASA